MPWPLLCLLQVYMSMTHEIRKHSIALSISS